MTEQEGFMIRTRPGVVKKIVARCGTLTKVTVAVEGKKEEAINYDQLTGFVKVGDEVILNTTALSLGLGSGGVHFIIFNFRNKVLDPAENGHIMKLRYTPFQLKVLGCEEEKAGYQDIFERFESLEGMPVVVGELHSMLLPALVGLRSLEPEVCVCYIMTDGGALPICFSDTVRMLKKFDLLQATITCGHAFGGDFEAVNVYSALIAAREIVCADVCIVTMGPGVVGTGTKYGYSGIESGENINRVGILRGSPIGILRVSFADQRLRHQGISHHSLTALGEVTLLAADVPVPVLDIVKMEIIEAQLKNAGIYHKHRVKKVDSLLVFEQLKKIEALGIGISSMGRKIDQDPDFFLAAAAAGLGAAECLKKQRDL